MSIVVDKTNNSWEVAKNDHHPSTAQKWKCKSKIFSPHKTPKLKTMNKEEIATKPPIEPVNPLESRIRVFFPFF